jgi:hypothetical protein
MAAGAVGTMALDVASYGDMVVRGRPASTVPARVVGTLARKAGVKLSTTDGSEDPATQNRLSALGALSGYFVGLGVGAAYGLLRPRLRTVPLPVAAAGLGLAAMASSDLPIALTGVSDPRTWSPTDWASDLIPHLAYGLFAALTYDAFAR